MSYSYKLVIGLLLLVNSFTIAQSSFQLDGDNVIQTIELTSNNHTVSICNLEIGNDYSFSVHDIRNANHCDYEIYNQHGDFIVGSESYSPRQKCEDFIIERSNCQYDQLGFSTVSFGVFKRFKKVEDRVGKLEMVQNYDAKYLIDSVFLGGTNFQVENVIGGGELGVFYGGATNIGIESGIVLSNAPLYEVTGANGATGDGGFLVPSLNSIPVFSWLNRDKTTGVNRSQKDYSFIEFDFYPTGNTVEFEFIFASDEYCDYVNGNYVDAFAFAISGPGIEPDLDEMGNPNPWGVKNIALVPDVNDPSGNTFIDEAINVTTINQFNNSSFYRDNNIEGLTVPSSGSSCSHQAGLYDDPCCPLEFKFDGLTTVLKARADVQSCEKYHIALMVGDGTDQIFGSAVFLGANTFNSGGQVALEIEFEATGSNYLYEGCGPQTGVIRIDRTSIGEAINTPIDIGAFVYGDATKNKDYTLDFNKNIHIEPGQPFKTLEIVVIPDTIENEGVETVYFELDIPASCAKGYYSFDIIDVPPIEIDMKDTFLMCDAQKWTINPIITGGLPEVSRETPPHDYIIQWAGPDGFQSTDKRIDFTPPSTPGVYEYVLFVTDDCGDLVTDTSYVLVAGEPTASITGTGDLCPQNPVGTLQLTMSGVAPFTLVYSIDGVNQPPVTLDRSPFNLEVTQKGTYELVSISSGRCDGVADGLGVIGDVVFNLTDEVVDTKCFNGLDGTASVAISGGTYPYDFQWSNGGTDSLETDLSAGNYTVTITDDKGCISQQSVAVGEPSEVMGTAMELAGTTCANPTNGSASATGSGGTAPYSYSWNNGGGNGETVSDLTAGPYIVTITDTNGCTGTASVDISSDSATPAAVATAENIINCKNTVSQLSSNGSTTGAGVITSWKKISGQGNLSNTDIENPTVDGVGVYELTVTAENGCTNSSEVEVFENITRPDISISTPDELTCTTTSVDITVTANQAGNYAYLWSNGSTTATVSVSNPGAYDVTVTNMDNGCFSIEKATVPENADLPVALPSVPEILNCSLTETTIIPNSSNAVTPKYEWYKNGILIQTDGDLLVKETGNYALKVIDESTGCSTTEDFVVEENIASPDVDAGTDLELTCDVETIALAGTGTSNSGGTLTYLWTTLDGNIVTGEENLQNPNVTQPGTYLLTITDENNKCTQTDKVKVISNAVYPELNIPVFGILNCGISMQDITVEVTNQGASTFNYVWNTMDGVMEAGNLTNTLTVGGPGTYEVEVKNKLTGCTTIEKIEVKQDIDSPISDAGADLYKGCDQGSSIVEINGTTDLIANYTVLWSVYQDGHIVSGENGLNLFVDEPGFYILKIMNEDNLCFSTDTMEVIPNTDLPVVEAISPDIIDCDTPEFALDGSGSDEGSNFDYSWHTLDGKIVSGDKSLNPIISSAGDYVFTIINKDNNCQNTKTITVEDNFDKPVLNAGKNFDIDCIDKERTLEGEVTEGSGDYTYLWTTEDGHIQSGENTLNPVVDAVGTYKLTVIDNLNGCEDDASTNLTSSVTFPQSTIAQPDDLTCVIKEVTLDGNPSNATGLTYSWETTNGKIESGAQTPNPVVSQPGTYTLVVTDVSNGCESTNSETVILDDVIPNADAGTGGMLTCLDNEVTLTGTGDNTSNFEILWTVSNGGVIQGSDNTLEIKATAPGQYTLQITNLINGCIQTDFTEVTSVDDWPSEINADFDPPLCYGELGSYVIESVEGGTPPYLYSLDGVNYGDIKSFRDLRGGEYNVYLIDANGCKYETSFIVPVIEEMNVETEGEVNVEWGFGHEIQVITNVPTDEIESITWTPSNGLSCSDCLNPIFDGIDSGNFTVEITNTNGCVESASIYFRVEKGYNVIVPNTFTPNNDNKNDRFFPFIDKLIAVKEITKLQIFDRWGELMYFESHFPIANSSIYGNYTNGWDGKFKNKIVEPGVYTYWFEVELIDGFKEIFEGSVTVIR